MKQCRIKLKELITQMKEYLRHLIHIIKMKIWTNDLDFQELWQFWLKLMKDLLQRLKLLMIICKLQAQETKITSIKTSKVLTNSQETWSTLQSLQLWFSEKVFTFPSEQNTQSSEEMKNDHHLQNKMILDTDGDSNSKFTQYMDVCQKQYQLHRIWILRFLKKLMENQKTKAQKEWIFHLLFLSSRLINSPHWSTLRLTWWSNW